MTRVRAVMLRAVALLLPGLLLPGCRDAAPPETRLLVLDGLEFHLADVEPYVAFLDSYVPEGGRKTKIMRVLEEHLIPLRLAQRHFAAERRAQKERADALCAVASNVAELEQHAALVKEQRRSNMTRHQAKLPVAMWAFDALRIGAVSPPIEVPQGWYVVGLHDLHESPGLALDDYVDALQVGFITHTAGQWYQWFEQQKQELADKATFVHPDYAGAIPLWIRPPKQP